MDNRRQQRLASIVKSLISCYSHDLTLELIPPHSRKSPLFIPNLTFEERMQMQVQQSQNRVQHLSHMISSTLHLNFPESSLLGNTISIPVIRRTPTSNMLVEVGIGTFSDGSYKSYLLVMDTGGKIIWTQCEGCRQKPSGHCYSQKEDYFSNSKSKSYIPFNPSSPYTEIYGDGSNSSGFYAKETFTFPSTHLSSPYSKFPNIVFGCGINNHFASENFERAGVFSMSMDNMSFISQIGTQSKGIFSYCFVRSDLQNPPPMYLRFGSNITSPQSSTTIKLLTSSTLYAVNMVDLGVNGEQLRIDKRLLYPDNITTKGLIVDSGSSISYLSKGAYDVVVRKLEQHFSKHKGEFIKLDVGDRLCYSRIKGIKEYDNIPSVTYYFEGGSKLDVIPEGTFIRVAKSGELETFCLMILPTTFKLNILGAFQQVNVKFIFNIKDKTLQFGQEDCAKNG
ncbi:unnamed protein product [Lupinus luteus]|uniref:Peptidase A1 domain-containing protein n=1 Tax=Lupinus luteus TaxID=3873 RepID=A0AAV1X7X9_LUPLU